MRLQAAEPRIVLASQSPFRATLMRSAGLIFETDAAHIDEAAIKRSAQADQASVDETAVLLAELKAARVAQRHAGSVVIGADQILVCENRWFDKPENRLAARAQLQMLRGKTHTLVTAVVCIKNQTRIWHTIVKPRLTMRDFSDPFLETYLDLEGDLVTTTVGGYRLEGPGIQLFDSVAGDHSAVVGLPMLPLMGFLRQHGILVA